MVKKLFIFCGIITFVVISSALPVSAETRTIATVQFTAYDMTYYDEGNLYWYIGEAAAENTEIEEYGCIQNQYGMASTNSYASVRCYEIQTDCDFSFEGTASLVFNEGDGIDQETAMIDFLVCTSKGKVIYPNDGSPFQTIAKSDGVADISGEAKHLIAGDRIYFLALNRSPAKSQYLQFGVSVWETEYGAQREGSFSNTNVYSGMQGYDGWYFMCARSEDVVFGTADIEVKSIEVSDELTTGGNRYPEDSGIVITTANQIIEAATLEDAKEPLYNMKVTITFILVIAAFLLIAQEFLFELLKRKRENNANKEVDSHEKEH